MGPSWNRTDGMSGFGYGVSPGVIENLALSKEIALKIEFKNTPPNHPSSIYIRGLTLEQSQGFAWQIGPSRLRRPEEILQNTSSDEFTYKVILAGRYGDFLPMIDYGQKALEQGKRPNFGRSTLTFFPSSVAKLWKTYQATSSLTSKETLDPIDRTRLLEAPADLSEDVRKLGQNLAGDGEAKTFIRNVSIYLQQNSYRYDLSPGGQSSTLDDFLFSSKAGYCEHYSSAVAHLSRAANIPARVVTGFLGGAWSPQLLTLTVRDLDAHAWTELWSDSLQRWIRFDPVTVLAPQRIQSGSEAWLNSGGYLDESTFEREKNVLLSAITLMLEEFTEWIRSDISSALIEFIVNNSEPNRSLWFCGTASVLSMGSQKETADRTPQPRIPGYPIS